MLLKHAREQAHRHQGGHPHQHEVQRPPQHRPGRASAAGTHLRTAPAPRSRPDTEVLLRHLHGRFLWRRLRIGSLAGAPQGLARARRTAPFAGLGQKRRTRPPELLRARVFRQPENARQPVVVAPARLLDGTPTELIGPARP